MIEAIYEKSTAKIIIIGENLKLSLQDLVQGKDIHTLHFH